MTPRAALVLAHVLRHVVLLAGLVIMLAPFVWMISTSLKPPNEIFSTKLSLLPTNWAAAENYRDAFTKVPLLRYLLNGVIVTGGIFLLQLMVSLPCAYALAKLRFRGRDILFAMVLIGLMIPAQVPAIPRYVMLYQVGLLDTYAALILPFVFSVFGIFLMRQFFRTVPDDLMHAARLDGLGEFEIVWRIMLPHGDAGHAGLRRDLDRDPLERFLLAVDRDPDRRPRHAAARHAILPQRGGGQRLRAADGRHGGDHRAAGPALPGRATALHRRSYAQRHEGLKENGNKAV